MTGPKLRAQRNGLGVTREDFAKAMGVSTHWIYLVERMAILTPHTQGRYEGALRKVATGLRAKADAVLAG